MDEPVWKWNCKLSWELFSTAVYSYRQAIKTSQRHKQHMHCKNGIFATVTSAEAFINETLSCMGWNEKRLEKTKLQHKMERLCIKTYKGDSSRHTRNNYLVHHKRKDHKYYDEINVFSLLEAIEETQEIIAEISFNFNRIFPYWITGVNFVNPNHGHDIDLLNDYEFWRHIRYSGIFKGIDKIIDNTGNIYPPKEWSDYKISYYGLWQILKEDNFEFVVGVQNARVPQMPYLTCKFWE